MATLDLREADAEWARRGPVDTMYPSSVLGWRRHYLAMNSFALFGGLTTTSTGESKSYGTVYDTPQLGPPAGAIVGGVTGGSRDVLGETFNVTGGNRIVRLQDVNVRLQALDQSIFSFQSEAMSPIRERRWSEEAVALGEGQRYSRIWTEPSKHVVRRSGIQVAPGVDGYARSVGATGDVSVIGELCLRHVPQAKKVLVMVTQDPEDGTTGLHFLVWTTAAVDVVVDAEDSLHTALFQRIPAARRALFSIGYEFIR